MHAVLAALPQGASVIILPIIVTVAIAATALLGIALYLRRQRRTGQLTGVDASASAISATGVLVSALLISAALGNASVAAAAPVPLVPTHNGTVVVLPVPTDLGGIQLPTK